MTDTFKEDNSVCMNAKPMDTGSKDAISFLPEEVLGKILSLIPTKQAASTSVLAKKWRYLFRLVHNLDFDDSDLLQPEEGQQERDVMRESFRNFVDRTLALQCASPIKKFSLRCGIHMASELACVGRWICNAVERGVLELDISIQTFYKFVMNSETGVVEQPADAKYGELFLPPEVWKSKTLVKLTLGTRTTLGKLPPDVSLPALKSLCIDSIFFEYEDLCYVLLPGCPVLEELVLRYKSYEGFPYCISSRTIKKLSVHYDCEFAIGTISGMSFDAPSLVSLDYSDYALAEYAQVNLESLVEARLDLRYTKNVERLDVSGLIKGICNIETLHLSPDSVDVISRCVKDGILLPVFNNLVKLSFGSKKNKRGWKLLPYLLEQSPKLETLIIQGLDGCTADVTMHPFQVKVLHVLGYGGTAKEMEHLKSIIVESKCLETVQVEVAQGVVVDDAIAWQFYRDLTMHLGVSVSSKCKILVAYFM
ncbi:F-box domain [Arabidopsis suecica]|uniref:F-box domain n=1 Tax=Arabidopsis suecica TaxID=45249 RepID=A0A8T2A1V4_ARASU|nr:F-box domain [Arabidopsis suecica]